MNPQTQMYLWLVITLLMNMTAGYLWYRFHMGRLYNSIACKSSVKLTDEKDYYVIPAEQYQAMNHLVRTQVFKFASVVSGLHVTYGIWSMVGQDDFETNRQNLVELKNFLYGKKSEGENPKTRATLIAEAITAAEEISIAARNYCETLNIDISDDSAAKEEKEEPVVF